MSHHACRVCGTYQGRAVLKIETEDKKKRHGKHESGGEEKAKS
jgi:hypothetical protein